MVNNLRELITDGITFEDLIKLAVNTPIKNSKIKKK
jgi:hypothetical protein